MLNEQATTANPKSHKFQIPNSIRLACDHKLSKWNSFYAH